MSRRDGRLIPLTPSDVAAEMARIGSLDADALRALWPSWFGTPPPGHMRRPMLALALSHRIQTKALGGLPKSAVRTLDAVADQEFGKETPARAHALHLKPGTKLVREYRGVVHEVEVVEKGFLWNGTRHRSLSAIALAITGTKWNGVVFFGVRAPGKRTPP
jgi:hypothetical protein